MAFTKLKLTTFGQTIEAKRHQGKGIKFTRVAIGDGLLGNGSMINRTELVSERHSMKIDGILTTDDGKQSVVVVTLDNSQFDEGFSYRELGLLAQDPDTQEEGVYLYDNAGAECEYLDTKDNGVVIYERLKLQIRVEQTENISFEASGNPLYLSAEDVEAMIQQHNTAEDAHPNKADLGEDGKVPSEQLPHMDYIPTTEKGKPGGVATLGADGKIPESQLGVVGVPPQIIVTVPSGSTVTCKSGSKTLSATSNGTVTFSLPSYGTWTVTATLSGQTAAENVVVDDVKQYRLSLAYFLATLRVTSESGATVTASGPKTVSGTVPTNGVLDLKITAPGTYVVSASKSGEKTETVSVQITASGRTYTAECLFFNKVLANNTWAQISKASAAGKASTLWKVGDEKNISVNGETITLVITGFNHDDLVNPLGSKAGITFGLKHLMKDTRQMNASNTTKGGFPGSDMYSWLQNTLLKQLPSDLQAVLENVYKKTSAGDGNSMISTDAMKLFLFSEQEVFGSKTYSAGNEGSQYPYFATSGNRIKALSNGSGSTPGWWERSPCVKESGYFCYVNSGGNTDSKIAYYSGGGVCFGFCV